MGKTRAPHIIWMMVICPTGHEAIVKPRKFRQIRTKVDTYMWLSQKNHKALLTWQDMVLHIWQNMVLQTWQYIATHGTTCMVVYRITNLVVNSTVDFPYNQSGRIQSNLVLVFFQYYSCYTLVFFMESQYLLEPLEIATTFTTITLIISRHNLWKKGIMLIGQLTSPTVFVELTNI